MKDDISSKPDLVAVVGHTAAGKTAVAAHLALHLNGEVISADSRQVYRGMDIGTGKDLVDYRIGDRQVPYHLIDLVEAGAKYSLFDFRRDFSSAFQDIRSRGCLPVLCGGTGLYIESVLKGYTLNEAPEDPDFRESVRDKSDEELTAMLEASVTLHNRSDTSSRERLIRALEVARANRQAASADLLTTPRHPLVFGIAFETANRRQRITERLSLRLESGMIGEVRKLLERVKPDDLLYYGLEYRYLTQYCLGEITFERMFTELNTAIHQFAKRQMTWFRGMERRGIPIIWIPGELPFEEKLDIIVGHLK